MGRQSFLPYNQPDVGDDEIRAVVQVMRSRWLTRGAVTQRFEQELSAMLQGPAVVAVSSCTAALHLALLLQGVGAGDQVITTPLTFAASVNAIIYTGATPVLVDIDPQSGNIDLDAVREAITGATRTILAVHYGGLPVNLVQLNQIRDRYGIVVVEDAAHALGARLDGQPIGSFGNPAAFSFYATKNLTTGEGGALTLDDPDMAQKVRIMALHGMSRNAWNRYGKDGSWQYDVNMLGFKYNMTDIQAAIGLAQIAKFAEMQKRRAEIAMRYQQELAGLPIRLPTQPAGTEHSWHLYSIGIDVERTGVTRDQVIEDLARAGIGTSVHFIPLYRFTYYRDRFGWRAEDFPHSEVFFSGQLSLPLYPTMSDRDVDDVVEAIKASVDG